MKQSKQGRQDKAQPIRKEHSSPFEVPQGLEVQKVPQIKGVNHHFGTFRALIKNNITLTGTGHRTSAAFTIHLHNEEEEEIGTILCAERCCCFSSLLGCWAQSWTGRHSDTVYQHAGIHFADLGRMTGHNKTCTIFIKFVNSIRNIKSYISSSTN